jgi:L,D-transpeptidase ErfK/SrfK
MRAAVMIFFIFAAWLSAFSSPVSADGYPYGDSNTVIGELKDYKVNGDESLIEIARKSGLGYNEIVDSNPKLDPFLPGKKALVSVPSIWILPDAPSYDGIVINLTEMRMYYFFKQNGASLVSTFPIGIGDEGNDTPVGNFKIIEKIIRPSWHVPESIKKERPELPAVVPPGPENPLGSHAMRLSLSSYMIHGTNRPWAVGRKVTHGCIRLYPEDIPKLFHMVNNGAKVTIVRQHVKVGTKENRVYVEVHKDENGKNVNYFNEAVKLLIKKNLLKSINTEKLYRAAMDRTGIPVDISN